MIRRAAVLGAIGSMAVAQLVVAIGAVIRVPLTVDVIGVDQYGLVMFVNAIVPLLLVPLSALRLTSRTLLAESAGAGTGRYDAYLGTRRLGRQIALAIAGLSVLLLVLPVRDWMPTTSGVPPQTTQAVLGWAGLACAVATMGAVGWGEFEASQRVAVFHVHVVVITSLGTALAVLFNVLNVGFLWWAGLAISTSVLPFMTVGVHGFASSRTHTDAPECINGESGHHYATVVRRLTGGFLVRSGSDALVRGFDPMLVAVFVGAAATAQLSVAQRLAQASLMVLTALTPLVAVRTAHSRGARRAMTLGQLRTLAVRYVLGAALAGLGLILIGPWFGGLLLADEATLSRGLLAWLAVLGVVWSAELALTSNLTSARATRSVTIASAVGLAVNLVLSFVLVAALGTTGPVIASVGAISLTVVLLAVVVRAEPTMLEQSLPGDHC